MDNGGAVQSAGAGPVSAAEIAAIVQKSSEREEEAAKAARTARRASRSAEAERQLAAMQDAADSKFRSAVLGATSTMVQGVGRFNEAVDEKSARMDATVHSYGAGAEVYTAYEERSAASDDRRAQAHGNRIQELGDQIAELGEQADRAQRRSSKALEQAEAIARARGAAMSASIWG